MPTRNRQKAEEEELVENVCLGCSVINEESADVLEDAVTDWSLRFPAFCNGYRYTPKDIFSADTCVMDCIPTYKVKRHFFRHGRRTAPKFCTHVRIETRLALT